MLQLLCGKCAILPLDEGQVLGNDFPGLLQHQDRGQWHQAGLIKYHHYEFEKSVCVNRDRQSSLCAATDQVQYRALFLGIDLMFHIQTWTSIECCDNLLQFHFRSSGGIQIASIHYRTETKCKLKDVWWLAFSPPV